MKYYGSYKNTLDSKGRVSLPSRFRRDGEDHFVLNRGMDGCLYLFTCEQYEKTLETIQSLPGTKKKVRFFMREWTQYATDIQLDRQGRILITQDLIVLGGLKKEVLFQGAIDRIEIWDPEAREKYSRQFQEEESQTFEDVAEMF